MSCEYLLYPYSYYSTGTVTIIYFGKSSNIYNAKIVERLEQLVLHLNMPMAHPLTVEMHMTEAQNLSMRMDQELNHKDCYIIEQVSHKYVNQSYRIWSKYI
jgi:hypothetical protein